MIDTLQYPRQVNNKGRNKNINKDKNRFCLTCSKEYNFKESTSNNKSNFCSERCRHKHNRKNIINPIVRECFICNKEFKQYPYQRKLSIESFCSKKCKNEYMSKRFEGCKSITWKGGKNRDHSGYIQIYNPNHPFCNNTGYVREHRLVVEKYLGRFLTKEECVHHLNEVKDDNRIENLVLFPNIKDHTHFHRQVKQFRITQPRLTEIKILKEKMRLEHERSS